MAKPKPKLDPETLRWCAQVASDPYTDEVRALAGDEPGTVGWKIAGAFRDEARRIIRRRAARARKEQGE